MSTYSTTLAAGNVADDAEFRVWGKWFSDQMTTAGWAKTADTGQVDWATVTRAGASNTSQGYEIRTSPAKAGYGQLYLKLEYGSASNVLYTSWWITLGWATDGAGTITGTATTRKQVPTQSMAAQVELLLSASDSGLCMATAPTGGASTLAAVMAIGRLNDADGNPATDGWSYHVVGYNTGGQQSITSSAVYTAGAQVGLGYLPPSYDGSGGVIFIAPAMPALGSAHYPSREMAFIGISNAASGATHSFAMFPGKTQTWRSTFASLGATYTSLRTTVGNVSPLTRWE